MYVSLRRLKNHEFHRTLRILRATGESWHSIFMRLEEIKKAAISSVVKGLSFQIFVFLMTSSLGKDGAVSLTLATTTVSAPTSYFLATASLALLVLFLQVQQFISVVSATTLHSRYIKINGFDSEFYALYHGHDNMALSMPFFPGAFLKERLPTSRLLAWAIGIGILTIAAPIIAISAYLVTNQVDTALLGNTSFLEKLASALGIFCVVSAYLYAILFNVPLPMKKNELMIRWGFLSRIMPRRHPMVGKWLEKERQ